MIMIDGKIWLMSAMDPVFSCWVLALRASERCDVDLVRRIRE